MQNEQYVWQITQLVSINLYTIQNSKPEKRNKHFDYKVALKPTLITKLAKTRNRVIKKFTSLAIVDYIIITFRNKTLQNDWIWLAIPSKVQK